MKLAIAKKTGYLTVNKGKYPFPFCIKGRAYQYILDDNRYCYSVKSESFKKCCHYMSPKFFNKYFRKSEFIEREEFHI